MEWLPSDRLEVENVALPLTRVPGPSVLEPSLNVTVPVAVPTVDETVAVKVTADPKIEGFFEEVTEVDVAPLIVKLADLAASTLPALSVLWNVTVLAPRLYTVYGPT